MNVNEHEDSPLDT